MPQIPAKHNNLKITSKGLTRTNQSREQCSPKDEKISIKNVDFIRLAIAVFNKR